MFRKHMHKLIIKVKQMSNLTLMREEKFNISKMPLKQNHRNISHIFRTRRDERLRVKYIEDITQWREDMNIIFEW